MIAGLADRFASRVTPGGLVKLYRHTPERMTRAVVAHRFRETVRFAARHSAFYRAAFAARGIQANRVRVPSDLGDFYTTPDDVATNAESFLCRPPAIVFESSGTSGKNKQVYYGRDELDSMGVVMAAGSQLMGIVPEDRVANAFDFSIWIPGMLTHESLLASGNFCLAFGKVDPIEVYRRLEQYRFNVVMGEPTWLIRLTELAEKHGSYPLKLLMGAAEEMPAQAIPWMQKVWHGAKVKMCYGSVELGSALGFQPCEKITGYHVDATDFLPEIIEPDENGYGELVFTTLRRRVMPLIRYRTRDVTRISAGRCACGLPGPTMEKLRGRRDEMVVASGGNLYPLMFENILSKVPGITHDWQVIFRLEGVREILEIHAEVANAGGDDRNDGAGVNISAAAQERIRQDIHVQATLQYPDFMKNLALGIFGLRIVLRPAGAIRTGRKLKRLIDKRHFEPLPSHLGNGAPVRPVPVIAGEVGA